MTDDLLLIDPHVHMSARTTDDYEAMRLAGCEAVCEPAFWAGFDRGSVDGFRDYFCQLTDYEPKRAAKFGLPHFSWLCINPKESEDMGLAREVLSIIPEFLQCKTVLGIGEIGLNKNTKNELVILQEHIDLAARHEQLILVHTPHLEDKFKGTKLILDVLKNDPRIQPGRVIIDHVEEHTVDMVLDSGFWAGITLYPESKATPARAIDMVAYVGNNSPYGHHPNRETRLRSFMGGLASVYDPSHPSAAEFMSSCPSLNQIVDVNKIRGMDLSWKP
jgi:predicted metal-dependent TIM-barrel fold hydrolase